MKKKLKYHAAKSDSILPPHVKSSARIVTRATTPLYTIRKD